MWKNRLTAWLRPVFTLFVLAGLVSLAGCGRCRRGRRTALGRGRGHHARDSSAMRQPRQLPDRQGNRGPGPRGILYDHRNVPPYHGWQQGGDAECQRGGACGVRIGVAQWQLTRTTLAGAIEPIAPAQTRWYQ